MDEFHIIVLGLWTSSHWIICSLPGLRQTIPGDSSPGPSALLPVNHGMCLNDQGARTEQLISPTREQKNEFSILVLHENREQKNEFSILVPSTLLVAVATIMSVINFENFFDNTHQRLGLALYVAVWLPLIAGIFRPDK
ncbi:hypothetical protein RND71_012884 [Anisodus tanguticus]|uniref:Uncharacterized protein n=1 Tax=Anisodus tanguticus TaxID=243964 RepID=A0AAE1SGM5_9SOLA|nr:hypothetical protein RND71_012884 [Anisodus tanguticus]